MKYFNKMLSLLIILSMLVVSCTACFEETTDDSSQDQTTNASTTALAPDQSYVNISRGESVDINKKLVIINDSFTPAQNHGGYVSTAQLSATISGYPSYYTYFSATVTVTWTYNEISEVNQTGVDKTISTTIALDAEGNGHYSNQISFQGCRDVKLVGVSYEFTGTATRK